MKICDLKKQGSNDKGFWLIGTLVLDSGLEINSIFSTNLTKELDLTKEYQVKRVKISNFKDRMSIRLEF